MTPPETPTLQPPKLTPRTDEELRRYLKRRHNLVVPDTRVCPHHTPPFRAFADAFFARSSVMLWKASRGFGGKSFLMALLGDCEADLLGANVTILGGSGEQSKRVVEYLDRMAGSHTDQSTMRKVVYPSGGIVRALTASTKSVRGPHPQRLRIDEADETDLRIVDAAFGQPMSAPRIAKQTVVSSTHHYPDGTMTEMIARAASRNWPVYEWCYKESMAAPDGWLTRAEVESKRNDVTEAMWQTEYDLQEPSPESRAIVADKVNAMFSEDLGIYLGDLAQYIELEPPQLEAQYATGADWAKEQDWTIIVTYRVDVYPRRLVAFERRGREPWPLMVARFNDRVRRFPGAAAHDKTGVGNVVDDYLEVPAIGLTMVGKPRTDLFSAYISAIERGDYLSPRIRWMHGEHLYATRRDLFYSGQGGHPPDTVVAGAMVDYAVTNMPQTSGNVSGSYRG